MIQEEIVTTKVLHAECGRCGHKWDLKRGVIPKSCPACHSPYWNRERKHKVHFNAAMYEAMRAQRRVAAQGARDAHTPHGGGAGDAAQTSAKVMLARVRGRTLHRDHIYGGGEVVEVTEAELLARPDCFILVETDEQRAARTAAARSRLESQMAALRRKQ